MNSASTIPQWVDFHCHLDLYQDHERLLRECAEKKIATLGVTTTPKAFARNVELAGGIDFILVGLGLHPQLFAERSDELPLFEKLLSQTRYIGEVGLDAGSRFYASFAEQQRVFQRILRACDEHGNKILSIHSVRSTSKVLRALEDDLRNATCVPVLHWFATPNSPSSQRRLSQTLTVSACTSCVPSADVETDCEVSDETIKGSFDWKHADDPEQVR